MKIQLAYYLSILLYFLLSCGCQTTGAGSNENEFTSGLIENFANPPIEARPKALWTWLNGNVDSMAITKEMEAAKEKGMAGFDIWDVGMLVDPEGVVPNGPPFLSDSSLAAIAFAVDEGDRLGLEIGLVLSSSWNAGGHWIPPQFGAMGLFRSTIQVHGPALINQKIPFPELPEMDNKRRHKALIERDPDGKPTYFKDVAVLAIPVSTDSIIADTSSIIDVSAFVDSEFNLSWSAPPGDWSIIRYVCTGTGQTLSIPSKRSMGRMLDHFSKEAMQFNLDYIFQKLESVLDPVSGRSLNYLYTDSYEVNSAVWTPSLPEAFEKRKAYSLKKFLPVLDGFTIADHNITDGFKFDLSKVLSDMIIENHYQFARKYCEDRGIGFAAEAGGPGPPVHNVPFEDLKALGALTLPRGEFWLDHPRGQKHVEELQIVKGIASAAHLYDLPFVEAESFTSVWLWQEGPGDLKAVADRAFCEGLNKIVYHTFPHTPRNAGFPGWVYNFGTLIHLNNVWWEHSEVLHYYLSRASYLLQQGSFKGQVLYYYGDQAPNFVPPKKRMPDLPFGYDYDYINTDIILNKIDVANGQLVLPAGNQYDVLVLLEDKHINPKVLKKMEQLISKGAWVVGQKPSKPYSLNLSPEEQDIVTNLPDKLWGACNLTTAEGCNYGKGMLFTKMPLGEVLSKKNVSPSLQVHKDLEDHIDFIKQETKSEDIYLVRNKTLQWLHAELQFNSRYKNPVFLDLKNGTNFSYPLGKVNPESITLQVVLPPAGMLAYAFTDNQSIHLSWMNEFNPGIYEQPTFVFHNGKCLNIDHATKYEKSTSNMDLEDWSINFQPVQGTTKTVHTNQLFDWTTSEDYDLKYFSGKAVYESQYELSRRLNKEEAVWLEAAEVQEVGKVMVNGQLAGFLWTPPYGLDITEFVKAGNNQIIIEVTNLLNNHMVGDYNIRADLRKTNTNVNKGPNAWMMPWNEVPLKSSGLMGPVSVRIVQVL